MKRIVARHSGKQTTTGKYIVLAINALKDLVAANPGEYEVLLYDLGNHKVTRSIRTSVVVDSASLHAAYPVLPGQDWTCGTVIPT
jgi:hypothetical protein